MDYETFLLFRSYVEWDNELFQSPGLYQPPAGIFSVILPFTLDFRVGLKNLFLFQNEKIKPDLVNLRKTVLTFVNN